MFPPRFKFDLTGAELDHLKQLIFPTVRIDLPERKCEFSYTKRISRLKSLDNHQEIFARKYEGGHRIIVGSSGSGGLDEMTNYVTCCHACNQRKGQLSLDEFAQTIEIGITDLPIHGDPVIDNNNLPLQIRLLRKQIFEKYRSEKLKLSGKGAQKKLEKTYRREFWNTPQGQSLEKQFPELPRHARIMIPEIQTIAGNEREFWLLVELSKSANTRNLIGTLFKSSCSNIEALLRSSISKTRDERLRKRMKQALARFDKKARKIST
ncbi:MAG: hypothetical protein ACTSRW_15430 [Candidatus Helarchaeota archaeon]